MKTTYLMILLGLLILESPLSAHFFVCDRDEYRCRSGMCIPDTWVCDGSGDCLDNEDEGDCRRGTNTCEFGRFQCEDGTCIPGRWKCDADPDCDDGSDERDCQVQVQQAA